MGSQAENIVHINEHRPKVKADIEKGFDRLAHELTNALAKNDAKLSGCEFQIVFALIGKTYRYHKKTDWVANTQLCQITGMSKAHVSKTIKSLIAKKIVFRDGREMGINPVVSDWEVNQSVNTKKLTNQSTGVNQSVKAVNQSVNSSCPIRPPHKKTTNTKETNTKENCSEPEVSKPKLDIFLKLPLNKKNTFYTVTENEVSEKIELYPAVNVRQEYRVMLDWLNSNPSRRKTPTGIKKFVTGWLSKQQNRGGYHQQPSQPKPKANGFAGGFEK